MPLDNPYASPQVPASSGRPGEPGLGKFLAKWGILAPLNAIASLILAQSSVSHHHMGDTEVDTPGLTFFSWPQMIAGIAIIAASLALLDHAFARNDRRFLSRSLTYGAVIKALSQMVVAPDLIIGAIAVGLVSSLPGRGGPMAVLLATLLCGLIAVAAAFAIGLVVVGLASPPRHGK